MNLDNHTLFFSPFFLASTPHLSVLNRKAFLRAHLISTFREGYADKNAVKITQIQSIGLMNISKISLCTAQVFITGVAILLD